MVARDLPHLLVALLTVNAHWQHYNLPRTPLENSWVTSSPVNSPVASVALAVAALRLAAADSQAVRAFFIPSSMLIVREPLDRGITTAKLDSSDHFSKVEKST